MFHFKQKLLYRSSKYPLSPLYLYKELLKSQYNPIKTIEDNNITRFNTLLKEAKKLSLYSNLPELIRNTEEIKSFPVITKEFIRNNSTEIVNPEYKEKRFLHKTSGSTGTPLSVYLSHQAEAYRIAGRLRFRNWWALSPSSKGVLIWGGQKKRLKRLDRIKNIFFNTSLFIPVFDLNRNTISEYFKQVQDFKPEFFRGYKSAIIQFARLAELTGINLFYLNLKVVFVTSEVLLPEDRNYLTKQFGCPVANEYGAVESGLYAYECPHGGMHVYEESVFAFTNSNNELISTELHNYANVIINYKPEDKVIFSDKLCACGRTLKLIESIEGRIGDTILKPNGEELSQYFFYYFFKNLPENYQGSIAQYKITQVGLTFTIDLVPGKSNYEEVFKLLKINMKKNIGENILISINIVDAIEREQSGKLRFFSRK